jgi:lipoprotein-releasing system permease protein
MSTAAVKIDWTQVLSVIGGTLILSMLVLVIPSFLVRKIQPIKAIRFT